MKKEKVLVVSTYPPKGSTYGHKLSAVASYAKNTLTSIDPSRFEFLVLADKDGYKSNDYSEGNIRVKRAWNPDSYLVVWDILKEIYKHPDYKKIIIEFEWAMFGKKMWLSGVLPVFLLILRLMGRKVYLVSHAVLLDASQVSGQIGASANSLKTKFLSFGLKALYWGFMNFSHRVVVFEEELRQRLTSFTGKNNKIITIPHGVEKVKNIPDKKQSRKKLGYKDYEFVVMLFGFHVWYKGVDAAAREFADYFKNNPNTNIRLLLAGGSTDKYLEDSTYQKFVQSIDNSISISRGRIKKTGFIPEGEIGSYYSASDLIIAPYRVFVSSSGPLSLAFSYKKPFLISQPLKAYVKTADFKNNLSKSKLREDDFAFSLNKSFAKKIAKVGQDKSLLKKITNLSELMNQSREWKRIGKKYQRLLLSNLT